MPCGNLALHRNCESALYLFFSELASYNPLKLWRHCFLSQTLSSDPLMVNGTLHIFCTCTVKDMLSKIDADIFYRSILCLF